MKTNTLPVSPANDREGQAILAMLYTAPNFQVLNAFAAMANTLARVLNPAGLSMEEEIMAALRLAKQHLESVVDEPEYAPTFLVHLENGTEVDQ